jgi:hypothetical protein
MVFVTNVFNGSKYCPAVFETVGLQVPNRSFGDLGLFNPLTPELNPSAQRCLPRFFFYWGF